MRHISRILETQLRKAARHFSAVILTGPRQCGKTTLLKRLYPKLDNVLLEDPDIIGRVNSDPKTFIKGLKRPVILDEIQNTPRLLNYIRTQIDAAPQRKGQWFLIGSQDASLMRGVSESMAGRAAVLQLFPLSILETDKVKLLSGGYPDVVKRPSAKHLWFQSYIQTYLERDVRSIMTIKDLATFRRFLSLLAARHGNMLKKTELAAPLGVSVPTISAWLNVLETTGQIIVVPPFYENFGKRLVKSPKVYFTDSGLVCHLLGIDNLASLRKSLFYGALFEGFVAAEIVKQQVNKGKRKELYYFRDQQGLEVDFIVPYSRTRLALIEAKATRAPVSSMAKPLRQLAATIATERYRCRAMLVHSDTTKTEAGNALAPGVSAVSLPDLLKNI